ncbi:MAG: hypothetical protein ACXV5Q_06645 [Frankiaceae bacterium]
MGDKFRRVLGWWLFGLASVLVGHLVWAWPLACRLNPTSGNSVNRARAHWLGLEFSPTPQFSLILIVVLTAMAGSVAIAGLVFSNRAGQRMLEQRWEWWYLLRPLCAAAIAVLFYVVVKAGLLSVSNASSGELAFAAAVGGLAGLFTDRVLAVMRMALGVSSFNNTASERQEAQRTGGANGLFTADGGRRRVVTR